MGVGDKCHFSFEQQCGNSLNCRFLPTFSAQQSKKFAGKTTSLVSVCKETSSPMTTPSSSAGVAEQFLVTDWNPLVSMDRNVDFDGSSGISSYSARVPQNQGISCSNTVIEQCQRPHTFNSESIPEAVNSLDLWKGTQISSSLFPPVFRLNNRHGMESSLKGKKRKSMSQYGALHPHSPKDRIQNAENEQQKNVSIESVKSSIETEKKQKTENPSGTIHKPIASHAEGFAKDSDAPKEDYIHVRAKRGQATNSHSLAERVRREKISERMKLLQDLVPGCNKITGKAMMLDEIINYVQSLQRQVEFLSMKLAAVNPELPIDIEQILSKDIVHLQHGSLAALGCGPGMNISHPHLPPQGFMQPEMMMCNLPNSGDMMSSVIPQVSSMAQLSGMWDDELQTGFIPNLHFICSDLNGSMKMEL